MTAARTINSNTIYLPPAAGQASTDPHFQIAGKMPTGQLAERIPLRYLNTWDQQLTTIANGANANAASLAKKSRNWKIGCAIAVLLLGGAAAGALFVLPKHVDLSSDVSKGIAGAAGGVAVVVGFVTLFKVRSLNRQANQQRDIANNANNAQAVIRDPVFLSVDKRKASADSFVGAHEVPTTTSIDFAALCYIAKLHIAAAKIEAESLKPGVTDVQETVFNKQSDKLGEEAVNIVKHYRTLTLGQTLTDAQLASIGKGQPAAKP